MKTPGGSHLLFGIAFAVMAVLFTDWCAVVFECGCRSIWNGGAEFCNIHAAAPPHCPWCAHPILGGATAFFAALGGQWGRGLSDTGPPRSSGSRSRSRPFRS